MLFSLKKLIYLLEFQLHWSQGLKWDRKPFHYTSYPITSMLNCRTLLWIRFLRLWWVSIHLLSLQLWIGCCRNPDPLVHFPRVSSPREMPVLYVVLIPALVGENFPWRYWRIVGKLDAVSWDDLIYPGSWEMSIQAYWNWRNRLPIGIDGLGMVFCKVEFRGEVRKLLDWVDSWCFAMGFDDAWSSLICWPLCLRWLGVGVITDGCILWFLESAHPTPIRSGGTQTKKLLGFLPLQHLWGFLQSFYGIYSLSEGFMDSATKQELTVWFGILANAP